MPAFHQVKIRFDFVAPGAPADLEDSYLNSDILDDVADSTHAEWREAGAVIVEVSLEADHDDYTAQEDREAFDDAAHAAFEAFADKTQEMWEDDGCEGYEILSA